MEAVRAPVEVEPNGREGKFQMHTKLSLLCMAIAVFLALAGPPEASASPAVTDGGLLAVGTSVTGHSTGEVVITGPLNLRCTTAHLTGTLVKNTGSEYDIEVPTGGSKFTGTGTGGDCTSAFGSSMMTIISKTCFVSVAKTDNVQITGCGANLVLTMEITGTGTCKYSTSSMTGSHLTNANLKFSVFEQVVKKVEGGIFCPAEGKADMDLDWYTTGSTPNGTPGPALTES
jgi:hypothetical protein